MVATTVPVVAGRQSTDAYVPVTVDSLLVPVIPYEQSVEVQNTRERERPGSEK